MALRLTVLCATKFRHFQPIFNVANHKNIISRPRCAEISFFGFTFGNTDKKVNKNCPEMTEDKIVHFAQVKEATKNDSIYIIDVREPHELKETGEIPNSINIPLGDVAEVLNHTSAESFKQQYGRNKPDICAPIIFTCRSGKRAATAAEMVERVGYENTKIYEGSWLDWASASGFENQKN